MRNTGDNPIIAREIRARRTALKVITALSVFAASLLFFLAVPLFPRELMVIAAICLGILAYRAPTPALVVMLVLVIPGYVYQLGSALPAGVGLPIPMMAIMFVLLLLLAVYAGEHHEPLSFAAGAVAFILMLTPVAFLALPVILGIILLGAGGLRARTVCTLLTFALFYYPVLAINGGNSTGAVPILEPVTFQALPPVPVLSLPEITTRLGQIMETAGTENTLPYLSIMAEYWPLSFEQRLFPVGILFCLLAGAAITVGARTLHLFRWLEKREVGRAYLPYAAPAASLFAGVLAFILLTIVLARPLDYSSPASISAILVGTTLIGGSASIVEVFKRERDRIVKMRARLADQAGIMQTQTDIFVERTQKTKAQCYRMDTSAEEALGEICKQELAFTRLAVRDMSPVDLEKKMALFQELQNKLNTAVEETRDKLCRYYDEDWQRYNDHVMMSQKYGFSLGETLRGPAFSQLTSMEYEEVLKLQMSLNESYRAAALSLAEGIEKLEGILRSQVDPEFKNIGINIARDYLAQERYAAALQEFLLELGNIEHFLMGTMAGLDKAVRLILDGLKEIVDNILLPTAVNLGDTNGVSYYKELSGQLAGMYDAPSENQGLPEMMRTVARVSEIGEITTRLSSRLGDRIMELEKSIRSKTPYGHSWGIDPTIQDRMAEISRAFRESPGPASIHVRLAVLKSRPFVLESAAQVVRDYSIIHELLINYANIEPMIEVKLNENNMVNIYDLPLNRKYSQKYLELYSLKHHGAVQIEGDTGSLVRVNNCQTVSNNGSKI